MRPMAIQTTSRTRLTRLNEMAVVDDSPSATNVARKPPSSTPRLAGIRKVATLIAVPNASITVAVASDTSVPRKLRVSRVSGGAEDPGAEVKGHGEAHPPRRRPIKLAEGVIDLAERGATSGGGD